MEIGIFWTMGKGLCLTITIEWRGQNQNQLCKVKKRIQLINRECE
jgi:hypothetical protein